MTSQKVKEAEYGFVKISELASRTVCRSSHRIFGDSYSPEVQTSQSGEKRDIFQIVENYDKRAEHRNNLLSQKR
jgi:hypothetical protein